MMKLLFLILIGLVVAAPQVNNTSTNGQQSTDKRDDHYGDQPTSYFEPNSLTNRFNGRLTLGQYLGYSQRALSLVAGFDSDLHRYDSGEDLINSFEQNLSYRDDLSHMRAHVHRKEMKLLAKQNELTLIENEQNQSKCGRELGFLLHRIRHIMTNFTTYANSKELDILDLMDSFGSPESELMMGNSAWFGSYRQCLAATFSMPSDQVHRSSRYCIASFSSPPPQVETETEAAAAAANGASSLIKMAVCLPRSCNSISILRYGEQIELLAKLVRLQRIPYSHYRLSNLYCLPDEDSPLRQFNWSAKLFVLVLSSWLTIVVYFSLKYEYIRMKQFGLTKSMTTPTTEVHNDKLMCALAFRLSWSNLFSTCSKAHKQQSVASQQTAAEMDTCTEQQDHSTTAEDSLRAGHLLETLRRQQGHSLRANGKQPAAPLVYVIDSGSSLLAQHSRTSKQATTTKPTIGSGANIDLSIMDGIKVVSMVWLIMAHTLLFFIRTIANGREFWSILRDARYLTVMAGIFPVDTFFTITGILTAYLKFNKQEPIGSPSYWLEALVHRYLRFMPMYLMVFWFSRDVSEFIGSGPLWDYSTANTSLRSVCKQESFAVPLLFQANFKPLDHHCVKPAWYLANDFQFLLITPLLMVLIKRSARLGYSMIGVSLVASLVAQFVTVFHSKEMDDFGALINFKPMFATYVLKNLWQLYVLPYNRIPPYLIGLLTGHFIYTRRPSGTKVHRGRDNEKRPEADRMAAADRSDQASSTSDDDTQRPTSMNLSTSNILARSCDPPKSRLANLGDYLCIKAWTPLVLLISIIYLPMITKLMTHEGLAAKIGTSSIIAFMRFVWSLAIARFVYIAATRLLEDDVTKRADCFIVRFLASPMWRPWSKIGLSALLIQWEVIGYLAQTQTSVPDMSMTFLLATMLACILITYLLATLIYITVEYPLSQLEQLYIMPALFHK